MKKSYLPFYNIFVNSKVTIILIIIYQMNKCVEIIYNIRKHNVMDKTLLPFALLLPHHNFEVTSGPKNIFLKLGL